jgi:hypothetical protein
VRAEKLTVDFITTMFTYTDTNGTERKAAFPSKHEPRLNDLANLLAFSVSLPM